MTRDPQEDKVLDLSPKDDILIDILMLAIAIVVIGAILIFVAPDLTNNDSSVIPVIHTPLYGSNNTPMNGSIVITFAPKTPRSIGECSPEAMFLMDDFIANNVGDKSNYTPKHIAEKPSAVRAGVHIALDMCEYIGENYDYNTGVVILWRDQRYFDHVQTWIEIDNETYVIETLYGSKDNRIYNLSEHTRIWDDQYKIQLATIQKGYEHAKKYSEGHSDAEVDDSYKYRYEYRHQIIRDIGNEIDRSYRRDKYHNTRGICSDDYDYVQDDECRFGSNYDGGPGVIPD